MFKSEDISDYISDIAEAISEVALFIDGMTFEAFLGDKKTINAVIRSLEVIGEATNISRMISVHSIPTFHGAGWQECGMC